VTKLAEIPCRVASGPSIGLIAAVPVTTALAAALATRITRQRLAREQHLEHAH
jgi:hypothetical protein